MTEARHPCRAVAYTDKQNKCRFAEWFDSLDARLARRVATAVAKLEVGNFKAAKAIGDGVFECSIHTGPGVRVYYGRRGEELVILLGGGTKRGQQRDIDRAKADWLDYQRETEQWH